MGSSTALTTKVTTGSPYQLDKNQVSKASSALLRHIKSRQDEQEATATKKTLIGDNDSDSDADDTPLHSEAVWLVLTTKKYVVDKNRLKPGRIAIPHSLNASPSLSICLITADPQRSVKNIVSDPSFPQHLSSRIEKVIGYSKLKDRYKSFETRRQLLSEHDVFLADDRIVMRLVTTLGKIFYKSSKRPIPVRLAQIDKVDGKRVKKDAKQKKGDDEPSTFASTAIVAKEIEKALNSAPVHLAPATTAAIRVGSSNFTSEQLSENIDAIVKGMTEKYVSKGWRNIKAIHVKGANTMAMPIWLASELWVEETDVVEAVEGEEAGGKTNKKRKQIEGEGEQKLLEGGNKKSRKQKAPEDDEEASSLAARKKKLEKQKAQASADGEAVSLKLSSGPAKKKKKSLS